jgi:hypothetical protein
MNKNVRFELGKIIGKRIVAINISLEDPVEPGYILFDDRKTFLMLCEQDYYDYHDCDSEARTIILVEDSERWKEIMADDKHFPDADTDID